VGLAYGRFTDRVKAEAHKEYLASIETYRVREGYSVPGEFVVVAGTKGGGSELTCTASRARTTRKG
jgi:hypothetical protein